ncbi:uncharacterized protein LOC127775170 [Oryza glaberrima]|uniref:uncharacterized protein LOC127775170 n=1 Tax=Oryza glaberrima TaxID=4538 RepID=UPI00023E1F33|nr:uncharacterized protein LOC127775170 [Oryza glaberrima]
MAGNNPDRNHYFEYLSSRFVDHFNSLPERLNSGEKPRPLDKERYNEDIDTDQSNTCAELAVQFYNQQEGNLPIIFLYAKDSHKFTSDDGLAHYHVNFKAAISSSRRGGAEPERYTLFAEVTGDQNSEIPVTVTMVTLFRTKEERKTRNNCSYCTGLRHPRNGGFVGHQPQEDSYSEEEEEGCGDEEDEDGDY